MRDAAAAQHARAVIGVGIQTGTAERVEVGGEGMRADVVGLDEVESIRQRLTGALTGDAATASPDIWEQAALGHGVATRERAPCEFVVEMGADMAGLELAIQQCRSASSLRRLVRVAAQMSGLMCLLFVKLDERAAFRRWAETARAAAAEAGDARTFSWVLAQEAYGYFYCGDLSGAVSVARHAQGLMRRTPCAGAALATALEARAHAARGDAREARRALDRAESLLSSLDAGSVTGSAFGYSESLFRFHVGNAYTRLHAIGLALRAQERALKVCPPGDYTDWALTRLDRASCLAYAGDASAAIVYATETLSGLREEQRQGIIALRGRQLVHALPPKYRTAPPVHDFEALLIQAERAQGTPRR